MLSLTLVYSSTNMSKSVWTSGFWKPLVHTNTCQIFGKIYSINFQSQNQTLEGDSIKDFNPDASIQYWFDVIAKRPGGSQTMENIKHVKEAATVIEANTSQEVEDEVEMVQEMDAVEVIEYDLVEDAEEDSDYKSNFDSEEEDSNDIFDKIAKY